MQYYRVTDLFQTVTDCLSRDSKTCNESKKMFYERIKDKCARQRKKVGDYSLRPECRCNYSSFNGSFLGFRASEFMDILIVFLDSQTAYGQKR